MGPNRLFWILGLVGFTGKYVRNMTFWTPRGPEHRLHSPGEHCSRPSAVRVGQIAPNPRFEGGCVCQGPLGGMYREHPPGSRRESELLPTPPPRATHLRASIRAREPDRTSFSPEPRDDSGAHSPTGRHRTTKRPAPVYRPRTVRRQRRALADRAARYDHSASHPSIGPESYDHSGRFRRGSRPC